MFLFFEARPCHTAQAACKVTTYPVWPQTHNPPALPCGVLGFSGWGEGKSNRERSKSFSSHSVLQWYWERIILEEFPKDITIASSLWLKILCLLLNYVSILGVRVGWGIQCTWVPLSMEARRGQWIPLQLELQGVVSHLAWVMGSKLESSARAVSTLESWPISPAFYLKNIKYYNYYCLLKRKKAIKL